MRDVNHHLTTAMEAYNPSPTHLDDVYLLTKNQFRLLYLPVTPWSLYSYLRYLLIYSKEQSPSWQVSQEITRILCNPKVH
jgi:hypothetical protein